MSVALPLEQVHRHPAAPRRQYISALQAADGGDFGPLPLGLRVRAISRTV